MEVQISKELKPVIYPQQPQLKAVKFPEADGKYVGQEGSGIVDLPTLSSTVDGLPAILSCWQLGFWARVRFLFTGRVWLCALGTMHPPVALFMGNPFERGS